MASVLGINPRKPIHDEGRWQCETCGKEFGYTQPINFKLQLAMLKLFMDYHEANCEPIGAAPTTTGEGKEPI